MKTKLINKLTKYAVKLPANTNLTKLKEFILSKSWELAGLSTLMQDTEDWYLIFDKRVEHFWSSPNADRKIISIDKFITKFSKLSCKQKLMKAKKQLAELQPTVLPDYLINYNNGFSIFNDTTVREHVYHSSNLSINDKYKLNIRVAEQAMITNRQANRLNVLMESVALDLNDTWVADWNELGQYKYSIYYNNCYDCYESKKLYYSQDIGVSHCSKQVAERVCELLNNKQYVL